MSSPKQSLFASSSVNESRCCRNSSFMYELQSCSYSNCRHRIPLLSLVFKWSMLPRRQRCFEEVKRWSKMCDAMHGERNTVFNPAMGECSYLQTVSQWNMNFEVTTWKVASSRLKIWEGNWRFGMQNFEVLEVYRRFGWQVACWFSLMMSGEVQTGWTNFEVPRLIHPILDKRRMNKVNVEPIPIYFLSHWHSYVLICFMFVRKIEILYP